MTRDAGVAGRRVTLTVSEPWDMVDREGNSSFHAHVVDVDAHEDGAEVERLLVRFDLALMWHGKQFQHFVVQHRRGHGLLDELLSGAGVECSAVAVTDQDASAGSPWGVDRWRGGLAAIAQLALTPEDTAG